MPAKNKFRFKLDTTDRSGARAGLLHTPHGVIHTPFFQTVATQAAVKAGILPSEIRAMGGEILLSNTYHLHLRPGEKLIKKMGGLASYENWDGPTLTDSGGFQVFSLGGTKVSDEGVSFKNHLSGEKLFLTPEKSIQIQNDLGADMIMAFDECVANPCSQAYAQEALTRTTAWAERCQKAHKNPNQWLLAIVQGSTYKKLRRESAQQLVDLNFPAYAIGGLAVGESASVMYNMLETVLPILPTEKPRYLMGVGTPENLLEAIERGVDFFDCVMPTRNGRHGTLFTHDGILKITATRHSQEMGPIEKGCDCPACQNYSRAYVHHLLRSGEDLGKRLATMHNLRFYLRLMQEARAAILLGKFSTFKKSFLKRYSKK